MATLARSDIDGVGLGRFPAKVSQRRTKPLADARQPRRAEEQQKHADDEQQFPNPKTHAAMLGQPRMRRNAEGQRP